MIIPQQALGKFASGVFQRMTPQRAKTYLWLFLALSGSVCANLLLFQSSGGGWSSASRATSKAMRLSVAATTNRADADQNLDTVRAVQRELKALNLYPGRVDGKANLLTYAAIMEYQQARAMPITGEPSQTLLRHLILGPSGDPAPSGQGGRVVPGTAADRSVRRIRRMLASLGYQTGPDTGRLTHDFIRGIRAFEAENDLPRVGRITARLAFQMERALARLKPRS